MLKVLKIRSVENAVYTPQYNRMRFRIPGDNLNTHLNESYLSFQVELVDPDGAIIPPKTNIGFGDVDTLYYSTCLLKVVRLFRGDSNIPLEEIQNFNMLDQNLKWYEKDTEDLITDQFTSGFLVDGVYQGNRSPFFWNGSSDIQIPLKYVFGLCKNKDFYLSDTDGLQIEFELEDRFKLFNKEVIASSTEVIATAPVDDLSIDDDDDDMRSNLPPNNADEVNPSGTGSVSQSATSKSGSQTLDYPLSSELYNIGIVPDSQVNSSSYDAKGGYHIDISCNLFISELPNGLKLNGIFTASESDAMGACSLTNLVAFLMVLDSNNKPTYYPADITNFVPYAVGPPVVYAGFTVFLPCQTGFTIPTFAGLSYINKRRVATDLITIPLSIPNDNGGIATTYTYIQPGATFYTNSVNYDVDDTKYIIFNTITGSAGGLQISLHQDAIGAGNSLTTGAQYEIQWNNMTSLSGGAINNKSVNQLLTPISKVVYDGHSKDKSQLGTSKVYKCICTGPLQLLLQKRKSSTTIADITSSLKVLTSGGVFGQFVLRRITDATGSSLTTYVPTDYTYSIPRAELVLLQESKKSSDEVSKIYQTWKMEPSLIESSTLLWQKQYILEPNVANALFLNPPADYSSLYSLTSDIISYRWALDNIDNTNRDVAIPSALHNDKLIDLFNNTGLKLKALDDNDNDGLIPMKIYTAMDDENVYMDNKSHTLQIVLNGNDTTPIQPKNVYLFKQVLKTL